MTDELIVRANPGRSGVAQINGAQILAGRNPVNIFGEPHGVRARIESIDSYSGHADKNELRRYVEAITGEGALKRFQEALQLQAKYANVDVERLVVRKDAGLVRLILEDDGVGFDYAAVMNRTSGESGYGLANLRERVRLLEGNLKIETAPGKGTRLSVEIPFSK